MKRFTVYLWLLSLNTGFFYDASKKEIKTIRGSVRELQDDMSAIKRDVKTLQTDVKIIKQDIKEIRVMVDELMKRMHRQELKQSMIDLSFELK